MENKMPKLNFRILVNGSHVIGFENEKVARDWFNYCLTYFKNANVITLVEMLKKKQEYKLLQWDKSTGEIQDCKIDPSKF